MRIKIKKQLSSLVKILLLISFQTILTTNVHAIDSQTNSDSDMNKKVLFVLSAHERGYWLPEVIKPYKDLTDNGYLVEFASLKGAPGSPMAARQLSTELSSIYQQIKTQISTPKPLKLLSSKEYIAVYFPGGAGPVFDLPGNAEVNRIVNGFYQEKKIIAALCHGPAALTDVILSNGKRLITGLKTTGKSNAEESSWAKSNYPFLIEDKFAQHGSLYSAGKPKAAYVVYDFPLLTGQNPQSTALLSKKLLALLSANKASN